MPSKKNYSIAIDGNEANVHNRVGSNVYAYEIVRAMEKNTRAKSELDFTILLASEPLDDLPPERSGWRYKIIKPQPFWTQIALPIYLFLHAKEFDVLYTPGHYAPRLSSVPYVSSVMDLGYLHFPDQFKKKDLAQLTEWTAYSVKKAKKIIAISKATKNDVVKKYKRKPEDVVVAYPSISGDQTQANPADLQNFMLEKGIAQPFILYVGTLQPRKNLVRLIKAFNMLSSQWNLQKVRKVVKTSAPVQLVLAGKIGWLADDVMETVNASPFKNNIVLAGYVTEELKYGLYAKASCSVLVGLYEGFGIPPLESLAMGTVPVVANTTSLPEVVGEAGILVDPYSVDSIANGLLKAVSLSAKHRAQYRRQGRVQLLTFSWSESAQTVLNTLQQVAKKHA